MPEDREFWQETIATLQQLRDDWRIHREVINRAVGLLNHEVVALGQRLDKDEVERKARQQLLDHQLAALRRGLRWLIVVVVVAVVAAVVAAIVWAVWR